MKRALIATTAFLGAVAIAAPGIATPKDVQTNGNSTTEAAAEGCGSNDSGNSLTAVYPELLWPPNHKYYGDDANEDFYFLAEDGNGGDVTLTTRGTHDQYTADGAEFNGSGNTGDEDGDGVADDVTPNEDGMLDDSSTANVPVYVESDSGSVQTDWMARAERAGTGIKEGVPNRTYSLHADAQFSDGSSCSLDIEIVVPHDMGKGDANGKKAPVR